MKAPKLILAVLAITVSATAFSQQDTSLKNKKDTASRRDTTNTAGIYSPNATQQGNVSAEQGSNTIQQGNNTTGMDNSKKTWGNYPPTADQSSSNTTQAPVTNQQTFPAPNFRNYYIPVLGTYTSADDNGTEKKVTITADENNVGKVWIEGLTSSKVYAILKAVPGTYKIPAQKQDAKQFQEGTLIYDDASKQINVCVGCGFKDQSPSDALANTEVTTSKHKTAKTVLSFTGTKHEQGTASN